VIAQIQASLEEGSFDTRYAIVVRPYPEEARRYQIVSGHRRVEAARRAGQRWVYAWVQETMTEEFAYLELLRSNVQSELTALEKGLPALNSGLDRPSELHP
jgi:ParB-like chromosome segregation protein Spo0J